MPRHPRTPDTPDVLRRHSERIYRVERTGGDGDVTGGAPSVRDVAFSFYGELALSVSPRWSHPDGALLVGVLAQLDTPGATQTVITVRRSGNPLLNVTIPAGETRAEWLGGGSGLDIDDYLQVAVVQAGSGAASLTVQARFR